MDLENLLNSDNPKDLRALFSFKDEDKDVILVKFQLWGRKLFPKYFTSEDAEFHKELDMNNLRAYLGEIPSFTDIVFRGGAKTVRTKLLLAFCISNDLLRRKKYIKVLAADGKNSIQIVTDIYNMLNNPQVKKLYPEIFQKTDAKREERMSSFTTATGVKIIAGTVGTDQRGAVQEASRPDLIWFEDFENRMTLRSAPKTKTIWDNMEEARTGLQKGGSCIYTCNYISERGNVHRLVQKGDDRNIVMIVAILKPDGTPAWDRYTLEEIRQMKVDDDDFEGERMCQPSASKDIVFDRITLDAMPRLEPTRDIAGFRIYKEYDASHRYASGHDISLGVGLDSSTSVFIDFSTYPAQVVGTFDNNTTKPEVFAYEIKRQAEYFAECLVAPEKNNAGVGTIGRLKQIYPVNSIFQTQRKQIKIDEGVELTEYGWHTNPESKPRILLDLQKAVNDGLLLLNCPFLIREARSYTRDDLMDRDEDPRLTTRHFDLLMAAAIAWHMRSFADISASEMRRRQELQDAIYNQDFDPYEVV